MGAFAFIGRDLRKFFRNPALITISLFLPLLQLVIIGNAFGGKVRDVPVSLVDLDPAVGTGRRVLCSGPLRRLSAGPEPGSRRSSLIPARTGAR